MVKPYISALGVRYVIPETGYRYSLCISLNKRSAGVLNLAQILELESKG